MKISGGCLSDIGNSRKNNQDAIFFQYKEQNEQYFVVGAVCDGIGGLENGEIASALIIKSIEQWFYAIAEWIDIPKAEEMVLFAHLKDAAEDWNEMLYNYCRKNNIRAGTTMSVVMLIRDKYYIIHVGDSRVYCYHNGLEILTTDACVSMMKNGYIKSYLDNYMGKKRELWFQALDGRIRPGDVILFCSDGFYHHMVEEDIKKAYKTWQKRRDWNDILKTLINTVINRGEKDNISLGMFVAEEK